MLFLVVCSVLSAVVAIDVQQCPGFAFTEGTEEYYPKLEDVQNSPISFYMDNSTVVDTELHTNVIYGQSFELKDNVQVTPCKGRVCRLKKGTDEHVTILFTPETDMELVNAHVTGNVLGIDVPFVGVDGTSICDSLENEAGEKASCPLKAGTKYVYKKSFSILPFYPSLDVKVHWALKHDKKDIICFEVPAKIV